MTSALRTTRDAGGELLLRTRPIRRIGYAVAAVLLALSMVFGFDPARDLHGPRLPLTVLYGAVLAIVILAALYERTVRVERDPLRLCHTRRVAGLAYRSEAELISEGSMVRLRKQKRPAYTLVIQGSGSEIVVDVSSWKSDLDPMGRELAREAGLGYEA